MGLTGVSVICEKLIEHGMPAYTSIALVQQGTTQTQRIFIGDLKTMPDIVEKEEIKPPTIIIVGDVVKLHDKLAWFEPVQR